MTSASNVFGRDSDIKRLWKVLEKRSVVFTAERRVGKTTVLQQMQREQVDNSLVIYSDLEKVNSADQFVESLINSLSKALPTSKKAKNWFNEFIASIGGTKVGGLLTLPDIKKRHWQPLLEETIDTVCENQPDMRLIFLWDEVPYMLQNIHHIESKVEPYQNSAIQILDTMRSLRHKHTNLRMIYTGSIGLHHVLSQLREDKLASQPTNDMWEVELGPIQTGSAEAFCNHLFDGNEMEFDDRTLVASAIIDQTDAVPFYIEKLVDMLAIVSVEPISVADVNAKLAKILTGSADEWEMEHFRQRLAIYYPGELLDAQRQPVSRPSVAKMLLNHLALCDDHQSISDCFAHISSQVNLTSRDDIVELLTLLSKDHYLIRNDDGHYRFRFGLLKRWWKLAEGL